MNSSGNLNKAHVIFSLFWFLFLLCINETFNCFQNQQATNDSFSYGSCYFGVRWFKFDLTSNSTNSNYFKLHKLELTSNSTKYKFFKLKIQNPAGWKWNAIHFCVQIPNFTSNFVNSHSDQNQYQHAEHDQ